MTSPLSHAIISKPSHDSSWVVLPVSTPSAYDPAAHLDREHSVLHELHLIHTDLKPENILLVNNGYKHVIVVLPYNPAPGSGRDVSLVLLYSYHFLLLDRLAYN